MMTLDFMILYHFTIDFVTKKFGPKEKTTRDISDFGYHYNGSRYPAYR